MVSYKYIDFEGHERKNKTLGKYKQKEVSQISGFPNISSTDAISENVVGPVFVLVKIYLLMFV